MKILFQIYLVSHKRFMRNDNRIVYFVSVSFHLKKITNIFIYLMFILISKIQIFYKYFIKPFIYKI